MTSSPEVIAGRWSLEIFCMSSARRQRRALQVFDRVGIPGVHVLGAVRPDGCHFVIVDAARVVGCVSSRRIVASIDPSAVRVQDVAPRRVSCGQS